MLRRALLGGALAAPAILSIPVRAQGTITLNGAVQFNDDHAFTRCLAKFEELVKLHYGKPINFTLHKNSSLGLEKQYFEYMAQGRAVDYGIVSPAHMSTFSRAAPFIDAPFLFRDLGHWDNVIQVDLLKPIADEVEKRARVMLIGYAGGGVRNIFANKPLRTLADLKGLKVRVQGAPIWSRTFQAAGMAPTVIAYNEIYNAIQNGVIDAGENEAAGVEQMRFFEVAPQLAMTQHAITIRPLCFSVPDLRPAAERPPGGDPPRRPRGGDRRPADRVRGGRDQARSAGEGRPAEARRLRRAGADEAAGGPGDGGLRQGNRRRADPSPDQRHRRVSGEPAPPHGRASPPGARSAPCAR